MNSWILAPRVGNFKQEAISDRKFVPVILEFHYLSGAVSTVFRSNIKYGVFKQLKLFIIVRFCIYLFKFFIIDREVSQYNECI